jgi:outer membrane protein, adhesin transport system
MRLVVGSADRTARDRNRRGPNDTSRSGVTACSFTLANRLLVIAALSFAVTGCMATTNNRPTSPFLTAMVRAGSPNASPNAGSVTPSTAPPAAKVNNASDREIVTGSIPPATAAKPSTPPPPVGNGMPVAGEIDRTKVFPQIASASPEAASALTAAVQAGPPTSRGVKTPAVDRGQRSELSLRDAVAAAVMSHPLIGAQAAKVTGSLADVRTAQGAAKPQLQVYGGTGVSNLGSYSNYPSQFGTSDISRSGRSDAGFVLKQLIFDFGAAKADIARSKSLVHAERLRLADQAEDIALRTANAYINLLEQGELITQIDKVVVDNNNFANLVKLSEAQGNGTAADVNRIKSKVIEVEAIRTDIKTAYDIARDEFMRLTKLDVGRVSRPASILSQVPPTFEAAFMSAKQYNPSLLALHATGASFDQQLASQRAQRLPRVDLQGDSLVKHYVGGGSTASQGIVDARAMVMVSYKMFDGGIMAAQADRTREERRANDFRTLDERESIELNLRRFYQALSANRSKEIAATEGITTAQKAFSLYMEQFKAGKRTVFEVLDSRMVVFTMHKNSTNAKYEQLRAGYGILRNMGRLVETAIRT